MLLATGVISSRITLGTLHLYQSASTSLSTSFYFLWGGVRRSFQAVFVCAAFCAVIEPPPRQGGIDYETRRTGGMRIQARGLAYTYPGSSDQVLHDINITVEPGQTLAIVGFNGGGKTTLVKLFMGLFTEYTGSLTINGVEIRDYDDTTLHTRTGCLFQDYARYPTTLAENVGVGDTTRMGDMAAVRRATERGGADEVARLVGERQLKPGGGGKDEGWGVDDDDDDDMANLAAQNSDAFVALCGSGPASSWAERKGIGLSGGQWQRIALARAFMRSDRSDLVVFDEPSASLDPRAEAELFDRIHALSGKELGSRSRRSETSSAPSTPQTATPAPTPTSGDGPTTVYISHRFSTVRRADVIAFVEGGVSDGYGGCGLVLTHACRLSSSAAHTRSSWRARAGITSCSHCSATGLRRTRGSAWSGTRGLLSPLSIVVSVHFRPSIQKNAAVSIIYIHQEGGVWEEGGVS